MSARELCVAALILSGLFASRLAEWRLHRTNIAFLCAVGGEEKASGLFRSYYALDLLVPILALSEAHWRGQGLGEWFALGGLSLVLAAVGLRYWVFQTLGRFWTQRCIFVPGAPRLASGPFYWLPHPEYSSRVLEILGICLFFRTPWTLGLQITISTVLLYRMRRVELQQLCDLASPEA